MSGVPERERALLRSDLERLAHHGDALTDAVYARWFALDAEALRLYRAHGFGNRREMTDTTLIAVHDLIEDASWIAYNVAAYGARHEGAYHVLPGMYATWVQSFVECLSELLAPDFDDDHRAAWSDVLARICRAMHHHPRFADVRRALGESGP